ncbi:MAG: hypothetical protein L0241_22370 [Planctomycetia bacterium]|nr:hypothetical protein [Planctomycetia bacterium]
MTPIINTPRVAKTTPTPRVTEAELLLRDVAFVLRLTRRVKEEMMADRPQEPRRTGRTPERVLVA